MKKNFNFKALSLIVVALLMVGCLSLPSGPQVVEGAKKVAGGAVDSYQDMIAKYQSAQEGASNFSLCVDTNMGKINRTEAAVSKFYAADVAKTDAYRKSLAAGREQVQKAQDQYQGKNPSQLDLAELQKNNALPNQYGGPTGGLTLMVNAFTEAPLPAVSEKVVLAQMDTINESFESIHACGVDWNKVVKEYNTTRNQITGDVVGRVVTYLKVKELPEQLPFYQGSGQAIK